MVSLLWPLLMAGRPGLAAPKKGFPFSLPAGFDWGGIGGQSGSQSKSHAQQSDWWAHMTIDQTQHESRSTSVRSLDGQVLSSSQQDKSQELHASIDIGPDSIEALYIVQSLLAPDGGLRTGDLTNDDQPMDESELSPQGVQFLQVVKIAIQWQTIAISSRNTSTTITVDAGTTQFVVNGESTPTPTPSVAPATVKTSAPVSSGANSLALVAASGSGTASGPSATPSSVSTVPTPTPTPSLSAGETPSSPATYAVTSTLPKSTPSFDPGQAFSLKCPNSTDFLFDNWKQLIQDLVGDRYVTLPTNDGSYWHVCLPYVGESRQTGIGRGGEGGSSAPSSADAPTAQSAAFAKAVEKYKQMLRQVDHSGSHPSSLPTHTHTSKSHPPGVKRAATSSTSVAQAANLDSTTAAYDTFQCYLYTSAGKGRREYPIFGGAFEIEPAKYSDGYTSPSTGKFQKFAPDYEVWVPVAFTKGSDTCCIKYQQKEEPPYPVAVAPCDASSSSNNNKHSSN
ncbi:hypothetical protein PYCC9005_003091 [Savitreella phatthalungensis]